jgi:hypothetical protein
METQGIRALEIVPSTRRNDVEPAREGATGAIGPYARIVEATFGH